MPCWRKPHAFPRVSFLQVVRHIQGAMCWSNAFLLKAQPHGSNPCGLCSSSERSSLELKDQVGECPGYSGLCVVNIVKHLDLLG